VGRIERPLAQPRSPWDVGLIAFEIARRHRFIEEMAALPATVRAHVLPSGEDSAPLMSLRYRSAADVSARIDRGYQAAAAYLAALPGDRDTAPAGPGPAPR